MTDLAILAVSRRGALLGERLRSQLGGDLYLPPTLCHESAHRKVFAAGGIQETLREVFPRYRSIALFLPVGAAVRLLAPLLRDKRQDPGVVAVDEAARHAVSLLSGHLGGGNELTKRVAAALGARAVLTTASDVLDLPALDLLGREWGWTIEDADGLTGASAALIEGLPVGVYQDAGEEDWWPQAPLNVHRFATLEALLAGEVATRLIISDRLLPAFADILYRPRTLVAGVGCVRGATAVELDALLEATFRTHHLSPRSLAGIATAEIKRDEAGLHQLAARHGVPLHFYTADELTAAGTPSGPSDSVQRAVGTPGVCEPAALLAAGAEALIVPKTKTARATVAVARIKARSGVGHLSLVGIGPGGNDITARARQALEAAEEIIGYSLYLDQVRAWLPDRIYHASSIGEETERGALALSRLRAGARVALVSSGDAGIYGMAGLVFELLEAEGRPKEVERIEVIPGVTAAAAAAALLGAPLMSDFATISLSDLMIPWETIERRLEAVAAADMVIALYNPSSARRRARFQQACALLLRHKPPDTPVGMVRNAGRPGQQARLTILDRLAEEPIDMLTVVLVGNSATVCVGGRLVTRRGYARREP